MISEKSHFALKELGSRLRSARLERNETQVRFASRLGISVPTLRKMEDGDGGVGIGLWVEALWLLDRLKDLEVVLKKRESLFDQFEREKAQKQRQRASSKRKSK